jgi:iron complex transport system ATP-binding protein
MTLELRGVSFSYPTAPGALSDVSLALKESQLVALTGPNGSGKSTLLKIAARVLAPTHGHALFDGRSLAEWPAREYARQIGYLPQEPDATFPMKAIEVVVSGRAPFLGRLAWEGEADYAEAEKALGMCDAGHLSDRFLDEMSGGERKRIFLARVLAGRPRLVLLDEPLAALDIAHMQQFAALLREIVHRAQCTVVFAAHDLNWAAAYSDRMIVMQAGRIAVDAPPGDVMREEVMKSFFGFDATAIDRDGRTWVVPRIP